MGRSGGSPVRRWILLLALAGVGVAGYLSWKRLQGGSLLCLGGSQGCDVVNASAYATLMGVPVAYLGLATYLAILVLALVSYERPSVRLLVWTVVLIGVLFSGYLTWAEIAVIDAICQWCVVSAGILLLLLGAASLGLRGE